MILDLGSLAFNLFTETPGGNPSWGTSVGQGADYKFDLEGRNLMPLFASMVYCAIEDSSRVTGPFGKGGNKRDSFSVEIASLYKKVFVNGMQVPNANFLLLLVKEIEGEHHTGRRTLKYHEKYCLDGIGVNADCFTKIAGVLNIAPNSAWFVNEIHTENQDEIHFTAFIVNASGETTYKDNEARKRAMLSLIETEFKSLFGNSTSSRTEEEILKEQFRFFMSKCMRSGRKNDNGYNYGESAIASTLAYMPAKNLLGPVKAKWPSFESLYSITDPTKLDEFIKALWADEDFKSFDNGKGQWPSSTLMNYSCFLRARDYFLKMEQSNNSKQNVNMPPLPLQQIFYGAPGTGKSQAVNKLTEEEREVIRTTFHPDSDYSTFVGAYKPTMKGDKIEYRFVKQAFLKAYIKAWLQYSKGNKVVIKKVNKTFTNRSGKYTITRVDDNGVTYNRDFVLSRSQVKNVWLKLWTNGAYAIPSGAQPGASTQYAICDWIYQNVENCTESSFDDGWKIFMQELAQNSISHQARTQIYIFSKAEDNDKVNVRTEDNGAHKDTVQRIYDNTDAQDPSNVQDAIANLLKGYNAESFDEAWDKLREDVNNGTQVSETDEGEKVPEPVFLVIEEINRGNCAQIFGDLFQLLDRKDGFSEYPIEPDEDISAALKECDPKDGLSFDSGLVLSEALKREIDATLKEGVADRICKGEVLVLPPNLHIWATMNTSDQSLFPMDSAFKRRWDWEYIKITEGLKKDGSPLDWKIKLDDSHELIDWWQFLQKINTVISNLTTAEDKQLGYFFCKPDEKAAPDEQENTVFSAKRFVDKVIFYLWNDVFKDYAFDDACCKDENEKEVLFSMFYNEDGKSVNSETLTQFFKKLEDDKVTFVIEKAKGLSDNKDGNKAGDENDAPQGNNVEGTPQEEE